MVFIRLKQIQINARAEYEAIQLKSWSTPRPATNLLGPVYLFLVGWESQEIIRLRPLVLTRLKQTKIWPCERGLCIGM